MLGPRPGLKEMNLVCWGLFLGFFVFPIAVILWIRIRMGMRFSDLLPIDFIYFYGVGRIMNEYPAVKLYDYAIQVKVFNQIYPLHEGVWATSPYPPLVAKFFSLLARYSIERAYFMWFGTSLALYLAGIGATVKAVFPKERLKASLIFCFALSFPPFLYYTLAVGQLTSMAVFSVGLAVYQDRQSRPFRSGLALSLLAYKPILLALLLLMLVLTRRFRLLGGFITGAAILILVATALAGVQIWPAYAHLLGIWSRMTGIGGAAVVKHWILIDLNSFWYAMPGGRSRLGLALLTCFITAIALWLATLLWRSATSNRPVQYLAWAATLTWTLLLNVYIPIYDSSLITIALVLTLGALRDLEWSDATGWIIFLAVLISAVSGATEAVARSHGIQPLTIGLFLLGMGQLLLLQRAIGAAPKLEIPIAEGRRPLYPGKNQDGVLKSLMPHLVQNRWALCMMPGGEGSRWSSATSDAKRT